jgi:hypothetical protein
VKHLSAQAAMEPQSLVGFSQGFPCGQQSAIGAVSMASCDIARAVPPATGSAATEKAIKATRMARMLCMT